jgi:hypothetical protein
LLHELSAGGRLVTHQYTHASLPSKFPDLPVPCLLCVY